MTAKSPRHPGGLQNDYTRDVTIPTMDVVCINRYYGWYNLSGDLETAQYALRMELDYWQQVGKPVILSEYGADTIAGLHGAVAEMFTEEFQVAFYEAINACLDERPFVVGETPWNFADFGTQQGPMRAGGNRKGLFTRDRRPKMGRPLFPRAVGELHQGERRRQALTRPQTIAPNGRNRRTGRFFSSGQNFFA